MGLVTVSVVSHGHGGMLPGLINDLISLPEVELIILTINVEENHLYTTDNKRVVVIENLKPKGFAENHNSAFQISKTPFFVVLNPDVRLRGNPFKTLISSMDEGDVGISAPAVINLDGQIEDSARKFPGLFDLFLKLFGMYEGRIKYKLNAPCQDVPWVAGMFMFLRSDAFKKVGGFDDDFFLYYEDVDLCARMWRLGKKVVLCPQAVIVHDARRSSHRDVRHLYWHLTSILRYLFRHRYKIKK